MRRLGRGPAVLWSDVLATTAIVRSACSRCCCAMRGSPSRRRSCARCSPSACPRLPHGLLVQALNLADRLILARFQPLRRGRASTTDGLRAGRGGQVRPSPVRAGLAALRAVAAPRAGCDRARSPASSPMPAAAFVSLALGVAALRARAARWLMTSRGRRSGRRAPVIPLVALAYLLHGAFLLDVDRDRDREAGALLPDRSRRPRRPTNIALELRADPAVRDDGRGLGDGRRLLVMAALGGIISHRLYPIPFEAGAAGRDRRWPRP